MGGGVEVPVLDAANYAEWRVRMKSYLIVKKVWVAVAKPDSDEGKEASDVARSHMVRYLTAGMALEAENLGSAKKVWDMLQSIYFLESESALCNLTAKFSRLKLAPGESLLDYATRVNNLANRIVAAGQQLTQKQILRQILMGLPEKYDKQVAIINSMTPTPDNHKALGILLDAQERMKHREEEKEVFAAAATAAPSRPQWRGGPRDGRPQGQPKKPPAKRCYICGALDHLQRDCKAQQGGGGQSGGGSGGQRGDGGAGGQQGRGGGGAQQGGAEKQQAGGGYRRQIRLAAAAMCAAAAGSEDAYLLDSGCSCHVTTDAADLWNVQPHHEEIRFGGGAVGHAIAKGEMRLVANTGGEESELTLPTVLVVPNAGLKMLSVQRFTEENAKGEMVRWVEFGTKGASVVDAGDTVMTARMENGVYYADAMVLRPPPVLAAAGETAQGTPPAAAGAEQPAPPPAAPAEAAQAAPPADPTVGMSAEKREKLELAKLWHRRYGHLGFENLAELARREMVEGVPVTAEQFREAGKELCGTCATTKQNRQPFSRKYSMHANTQRPLELLHMDVCGPLPVSHGKEYFVTLYDDFSKFSVVEVLAEKSEVSARVAAVIRRLTTQRGVEVGAIQTDRGREFLNSDLTAFLESRGIQHDLSAPYSPEQNGSAERLNQTLLKRVRAMLFEADLSPKQWALAVEAANVLRNRSPVKGRSMTPYQLFYGVVPYVSHLRVFGCPAYVLLPPKQRGSKVEPVSQRGRFVGYEPDGQAYRVLVGAKVVVSRDVVFDEAFVGMERPAGVSGASEQWEQWEQSGAASAPPSKAAEKDSSLSGAQAGSNSAAGGGGAGEEAGGTGSGEQQQQPRYPSRVRKAPARYAQAAAAAISAGDEPATYEEAMRAPDSEKWAEAIAEELTSLHALGTWDLEPLPPGKRAIPLKWVFKIKRNEDGSIERYKARLVAKGFMQREGIDYDEVFAPTGSMDSLRALLSIVADQGLELHQLDVKTAFLYGELEETVYVQQPPGYPVGDPSMVCRLNKSLYGLKQAPRAWHSKLKAELEQQGFEPTAADPALFVRLDKAGPVFLHMHVDDMLVAAQAAEQLAEVKAALAERFAVKDLGPATRYLNMEIERDMAAGTLKLLQRRYMRDLLEEFGMTDANDKATPLAAGTQLERASDEEPGLPTEEAARYRSLVGGLMYLANGTRPDIAYAVGVLARFMKKPLASHWAAAKGVLRYIADTKEMGLVYGGGELKLEVYSDADFAGDVGTRRSTTGYVFVLGGAAVSWQSKLQHTVALSTVEAEYMAASASARNALWMRKLLDGFGVEESVMRIYGDNQGALSLIKNPIISQRSKHIDVLYHFVRERAERGEVEFKHVRTEEMVADALTKAVPLAKFVFCRKGMGVI